jgi:drug/metabolite transporter (DMT)-like permease
VFQDTPEKAIVNNYIGEIAALGTSLCWTLTSIFFTISGRRVGSVIVNRVRLAMAVAFLAITHFLTQGHWLPIQAGLDRWFWLGLSGVIGLALGDGFLFQAFVLIGPRRSTLLMSLVPIISTTIAWLFLGETLSSMEMLAVGLTVGGIAWVVLERGESNGSQAETPRYWWGVLAGIAGSLGQAMGLVLSKKGMGGDLAPLSATLIRMVMAAVVIWSYALVRGRAGYTIRALTDRRASLATLGGAITGPFIGVWLSLVAVQLTRVGIASTLMALPPIFVLLPSVWIFRERVGPRAVVGTLVAIGGVAIIFLL